MSETGRPDRRFAHVALAAAALTLVVIVASAWMRHERAGLACADWPSCYGRIAALSEAAVLAPGVRIARIVHRIAATGVTLLVAALVAIAWRRRPVSAIRRKLATLAAVVVVGLAALGVGTPEAQLAVVPLANLLGGFLLLALLCSAWAAAARAPQPVAAAGADRTTALRILALVLVGVALAQAALGGLIGAQFALPPCVAGPACAPAGVGAWVPTNSLEVFRPWSVVEGRIAPPPDAAGLHAMHRILGMVLFAGTLALAVLLPRSACRFATALLCLALVVPVLGGAAIHALPSLLLTVLHNAAAAVLTATLAAAAVRA